MSSERDEKDARSYEEPSMSAASHVHMFDVTPKGRTRETIAVLVTLAVLFALLFVFLGHPAPRPLAHPQKLRHASSALR